MGHSLVKLGSILTTFLSSGEKSNCQLSIFVLQTHTLHWQNPVSLLSCQDGPNYFKRCRSREKWNSIQIQEAPSIMDQQAFHAGLKLTWWHWPLAFLLITPQRFNASSARVVRQVKFGQIFSRYWGLNMPAQKGKDILFSPDGYEIWIPRKFEKSQPLTTLNLYGSSVVPYISPYKVQNSEEMDTTDVFCEILIQTKSVWMSLVSSLSFCWTVPSSLWSNVSRVTSLMERSFLSVFSNVPLSLYLSLWLYSSLSFCWTVQVPTSFWSNVSRVTVSLECSLVVHV